jgi:thiamine biosynthesis lipoprotein
LASGSSARGAFHRLKRCSAFGTTESKPINSALLIAALFFYERIEPLMGTLFRVALYAESEQQATAGFDAAFARGRELDARLSDYKPDSELNSLGTQAKSVSLDLYKLLKQSTEIAQVTNGAFDITLGPVIRLWREARKQHRLPPREAIEQASARAGYRKLILDPTHRTARLAQAGMQLDLGGIAKGYAAQQMLLTLKARGIAKALVAASGDISAGEPPPGQPGWRIGLDWSNQVLSLRNESVSTSGDREQFIEIEGVRYSHIVDPKTGLGLPNSHPVTVIAGDGALADALATALSIQQLDQAIQSRYPEIKILRP